jgi:hypothetical protein
MTRSALRSAAAMVAVSSLAVAACDRSAVDPPGHQALGTVTITDRTAVPQVVLATWTHQSGWDRDLLTTVSHATDPNRTRIVLGVRMWTQGGEEIQLVEGGEYEARYEVTADPANVVDMDPGAELFHGDHVYVYGHHVEGRTGTAQLRFLLWHDDHPDGQTDAIALTFTD